MNALLWARKNINLWKASPVSGAFDERRYPFIIDPLLSLDDIRIKESCIYGPAQSFKSVFLQIATFYRLDMRRESILLVAQTDDDVKEMSLQRVIPWLERLPSLNLTTRAGRSSQTIGAWLWPSFELIMSGPGENAQNSKSVRFLHTDEAHLWCVTNPGALAALRNRMGRRWNRHALHATTAASQNTEIDNLYHEGHQAEWHLRCIHCNELVWPLWTEASREHYNGHEVFQWTETQSETETLDSIHVVCPHCDKEIYDEPRNRMDMDKGARYVSKNEGADISVRSWRWNAMAASWVRWRELFQDYRKAINSAKMGDLGPYEKWFKMQEVRTWRNEYPMLGDSTRGRNYDKKDIIILDDEIRVMSVDYQAGKANEGKHWWVLIDQWKRSGDSKRVEYRKCYSWDEVRSTQLEFLVPDKHVGVDCGHEPREVFSVCYKYQWFAFRSTDIEEFKHEVIDPRTRRVEYVNFPYSPTGLESSTIGTEAQRHIILPRGGKPPVGYAIVRSFSKPVLYGIIYALKQGTSGIEYGIARDIDVRFVEQINSYMPQLVEDRLTKMTKRIAWVRIKNNDHSYICAAQSLLIAIIQGYFPLAEMNRKIAA